MGEAATVCEEFKTKPRSGFGLNELLGATSRSPIIKLEDDALRDIKLD